ncbi:MULTISPECIES: fructosamine kinase family protein [Asticcacaulis]|uniref:fructosamine kinase family protein n=1 Tax=Asticcacaulis TaxID=76890 RepID=UPI001AE37465|nr:MULTISPECIES: fructosamine kinase family protein [Asticcacaulis]MBP2161743.1 fructosamine-3-kinase [Asticcacaulis solisilvae]MDR6802744.1 fructosamine-3-kinase [Asticcacaulis sp. BE141]
MLQSNQQVAKAAAQLLNGALANWDVLNGGDLSVVLAIRLDDGRRAVVKSSPGGVEADMLRTMAQTGAPVPRVLASDETILVMSVADTGGVLSWRRLGEAVRQLHSAQGPMAGWHSDYAFGPVTILNGWCDSWPQFWAENRLLPFLPYLPLDMARRIEALAGALDDRVPKTATALLHGDLWPGNVLAGPGSVTLVDPACYYGDGAVDLAMLALFGHPSADFYAAYGAQPDSQRQAVYSLWPALVHVRLFGDGYLRMVERCLVSARA